MTVDILDSAPPNDPATERALLASIVVKPGIMPELVATGAKSLDFHDGVHQIIFAEMFGLHFEGKPVDMTLLLPRLRAKEGEIGERAAVLVAELLRQPHSAANWRHYNDRLIHLSKKRRLRTLGERLLQESTNGKPPSEIAENAIRILDGVVKSGGVEDAETFDCIPSAEFDRSEFETRYHVENFLPELQQCVLAAQLKNMKSSLAVNIGFCVATGQPLFHRLAVHNPTRVLIMNGESGQGALQETGRRIAESYGMTLSDAAGLHWSFRVPRLDYSRQVRGVEKLIKGLECGLAIFDPQYFMLPGDDANNLMKQGVLLREMSDMLQSRLHRTICTPCETPSRKSRRTIRAGRHFLGGHGGMGQSVDITFPSRALHRRQRLPSLVVQLRRQCRAFRFVRFGHR